MRVGIKDIAERVGVSTSLVSMYLNHHPLSARIAEKTKRKIDKAVREMDYQPSATARSLKNGKSRTIGLVVSEIAGIYSGFYTETLLREADKRNYQLLISLTQYDQVKERKCLQNLVNRQTDGILYGLYLDPEKPLPFFLKDYPILQTGYPHPECNSFLLDLEGAMKESFRVMATRGIRKILVFEETFFYFRKIRELAVKYGLEVAEFKRDESVSGDFLRKVRMLHVDCIFFGASTMVYRFLQKYSDVEPEKIPFLMYSYTLPCDYFEHPRIFGAIVNPFKDFVPKKIDRIIEMIEQPEEEVRHLTVPSVFLDKTALRQYYAEQVADSYYRIIVEERGNILQQKGKIK